MTNENPALACFFDAGLMSNDVILFWGMFFTRMKALSLKYSLSNCFQSATEQIHAVTCEEAEPQAPELGAESESESKSGLIRNSQKSRASWGEAAAQQ